MAVIKPTNFGRATLATPPSGTGGLSFTVAAGKGANFPSPGASEYFYGVFTNAARSAYEVVKVEARATDAFTIATGGRGQDGTSAATWNTGDIFYLPTTRVMWGETSFAASSLAISALTPAADKVPYFTSATAAALADLTSFARTILDDANAAAVRATISASQSGVLDAPSGTRMIFQQTAAPTGWTKEANAAYNDAAMRVVTGAASTGGADAFTTHFGTGKSTAGYTLLTADIPSHSHGVTDPGHVHGSDLFRASGASFTVSTSPAVVHSSGNTNSATTGISIQNTGGGGSHSHTLNSFNIKYVDTIVAAKD